STYPPTGTGGPAGRFSPWGFRSPGHVVGAHATEAVDPSLAGGTSNFRPTCACRQQVWQPFARLAAPCVRTALPQRASGLSATIPVFRFHSKLSGKFVHARGNTQANRLFESFPSARVRKAISIS